MKIERLFKEADTSRIKNKEFDIAYGNESEMQKMDIFYPEKGKGPFPALIWIHGGAWRRCDKRDTQIDPFLSILDDGIALITINYRLTSEGAYPLGFNDCLKAIDFIFENARKLNIDPDKIGIAGESSGANYVLLTLDHHYPFKSVLSWYGVTDIPKIAEQKEVNGTSPDSNDDPNSFEALYLGCPINQASGKLIKATSPIYHIEPDFPPMLIQVGLNDVKVPYQQSKTYYEKAKAIMGEDKVHIDYFENAGHGDPKIKAPENMVKVREFFKENIL